MPKKIACPVDAYCRNWDNYNQECQENGCRESGFKKITAEDEPFYKNKRIIESELAILKAKSRKNLIGESI